MISAPWLFASAAIGYGYLPTQLAVAGSLGLIFATTASIIALATSALVQPFARKVHCHHCARGLIVATTLLAGGLGLVTLSISVQSIWLGIASSFVVVAEIGVGQVSGLLEVQRIATNDDLAGLTGVFYSLPYAGFLCRPPSPRWPRRSPKVPHIYAVGDVISSPALAATSMAQGSAGRLPRLR